MKKINVKLNVPSYDCVLCNYFNDRTLFCTIFDERLKMASSDDTYLFKRCQKCIDSEVIK